ncbi:MAG: oligoendopeptidase F family protein [Chloroflexi bacterium]|nr:oligoendopeptidase F family protein [Chloroflexota bacterium]
MSNFVQLRQDIPLAHTWNAESIFPNDAAWENEFNAVGNDLSSLVRFRGHLADNATMLADFFAASEAIEFRAGKVVLYASMKHTVDTTDQAAAALNDRARGLAARVGAAMSFAEPELLAIGFDKLRAWTVDAESEPRLAIYAHYVDRLEQRAAHVRSAEVEELLSQVNDAFRTAAATHGVLADADLKPTPASNDAGDTFEITQGSIGALRTHPDRTVRHTAFENYADAYLAHKNTMANALASGVKQDVFRMRARKYESSLEAALAPNHIPLDVFHNLIKTFRANLPTWHRYWKIRKRALGYDTLQIYDEKAPLTNAEPRVEFTQAVDWICAGMQPLGEEYVRTLRRGCLEQRWVDIYPNKGKRAGAFSTGVPGTQPFILMSYNDDLFSMSTLAHELGHSMHKYFTQKTQPFVYRYYGLFLAETASNFNQAMVRAYLLKNANVIARSEATKQSPSTLGIASSQTPLLAMTAADFEIAVIEEAMSNFHRYFFIMPTLARFELEIHERIERGQALTAQNMTDLLADLFSEAYGSDVVIDRERVGITWAQFPTHLYSNFYVYQYATGISAAHALSENILAGKDGAVEKYLGFLKSGGSDFPLSILKQAGVDLTTPAPVETTFGVFARYVDRLEELTSQKK